MVGGYGAGIGTLSQNEQHRSTRKPQAQRNLHHEGRPRRKRNFRLFEDSHGDVWIGSVTEGVSLLTRWIRSTGRFQRYTEADGVPSRADGGVPAAFCEDGS